MRPAVISVCEVIRRFNAALRTIPENRVAAGQHSDKPERPGNLIGQGVQEPKPLRQHDDQDDDAENGAEKR